MKVRWPEGLVAFLLAVALWYGVVGSEKVESQVEVRVDYRGLPQGLVVRGGLVNKVAVRVRASAGMLRSLAVREDTLYMDLSNLRKGENVLLVNPAHLPFRSGVEVMEIMPSRIFLEADTLERKTVPLEAAVKGDLPQDFIVQMSFTPPAVTLSGPSSLLAGIAKVVAPIQVEGPVALGAIESTLLLPLPEGVDATPREVSFIRHIGIKRKLVTVTRSVQVDAPPELDKRVRPDKVTISVAIPESQAGKAAGNNAIQAQAVLERGAPGAYSLPVKASVPERAELVSIEPARVTVTLEQRKAAPKKK